MQQKSFLQHHLHQLIRPKQIMMLDPGSHKPAKNWCIRPISLIFYMLLLLMLGAIINQYYLANKVLLISPAKPVAPQLATNLLQKKTAEFEAEKAIKLAHIDSLETIILTQQQQQDELQQRLNVFESILQTRKGRGANILQVSTQSINPGVLSFTVILVKGGNYPRHMRGYIQFSAKDQQGKEIKLWFDQQQDKLPYDMESHTFLHGTLRWPESVTLKQQTQALTVLVFNTKGKELLRKTVPSRQLYDAKTRKNSEP